LTPPGLSIKIVLRDTASGAASLSKRNVAVIIPAAGQGVRMGFHKKQLLRLDGDPILVHTVRKFAACPDVRSIWIAAPPEDMDEIRGMLEEQRFAKSTHVIAGGARRQDSVENCLRALPSDTELVAVHDAVRPFVSPEQISACIEAASENGAAILGILTVDTVKQVARTRIIGTIPRERVVLAQTPQIFRFDILRQAFDKAREEGFSGTDESSLVEHLGIEVTVAPGSDRNIKITKPADLELARFYLEQERRAQTEPAPPPTQKSRGQASRLRPTASP
jgi:2-C-methyl-D-erythritol 4-phosphate cytidylyltransferase